MSTDLEVRRDLTCDNGYHAWRNPLERTVTTCHQCGVVRVEIEAWLDEEWSAWLAEVMEYVARMHPSSRPRTFAEMLPDTYTYAPEGSL